MAVKKLGSLGLAIITLVLSAGAIGQESLVYCSEGSPEGFDPALYTAGTTFDASSRQIYNRLVEFEHDSTVIMPGLAQSYEFSEDCLLYTSPSPRDRG